MQRKSKDGSQYSNQPVYESSLNDQIAIGRNQRAKQAAEDLIEQQMSQVSEIAKQNQAKFKSIAY